MKKTGFFTFIKALMTVFMTVFLCACSAASSLQEETVQDVKTPTKIAVSTDLHCDPNNTTEGSINPMTIYNQELMEALFFDARHNGAEAIVLCGDLVNAGRLYQHEALVKVLAQAEADGLPIYAFPGNHDIGDVTTEQFADMYGEFGYNEAYSRDTDSLSYSVVLGEQMLILLDTGGYGARGNGGYLTAATILWAENQLKKAKDNQWKVLVFGHYPLLAADAGTFTGRNQMLDVLKMYGVELYICGHLHGRHISLNDDIVELVVEQSTANPCSYAMITMEEEDVLRYDIQMIDVPEWAELTEHYDSNLLNFEEYKREKYLDRQRATVESIRGKKEATEEEMELATQFFIDLMTASGDGTLPEKGDALKETEGYRIFMRFAEGNVYGRWIPTVFDNAVPYMRGFTIDHGVIRTND